MREAGPFRRRLAALGVLSLLEVAEADALTDEKNLDLVVVDIPPALLAR